MFYLPQRQMNITSIFPTLLDLSPLESMELFHHMMKFVKGRV